MLHESLEMNDFTDSECLPHFKCKFDLPEKRRKTLTLRSTINWHKNQESEQMSELTKENQTTVVKESQITVSEENQTIVTYSKAKLVTFKGSMVSEADHKYISTPLTVNERKTV